MATKKPTAKQLAARKKLAAAVKSGAFLKKKKKATKNSVAATLKKAKNKKATAEVVNGYKIRWNPFWKTYQVSHPDVGTEEFDTKIEAVAYARKG